MSKFVHIFNNPEHLTSNPADNYCTIHPFSKDIESRENLRNKDH